MGSVSLLDGATTKDGLSYFVMEYVRGGPLEMPEEDRPRLLPPARDGFTLDLQNCGFDRVAAPVGLTSLFQDW